MAGESLSEEENKNEKEENKNEMEEKVSVSDRRTAGRLWEFNDGDFETVISGTNQGVTITKLNENGTQDTRMVEAGLQKLTQADHSNLVSLLGFCTENNCRVNEHDPHVKISDFGSAYLVSLLKGEIREVNTGQH